MKNFRMVWRLGASSLLWQPEVMAMWTGGGTVSIGTKPFYASFPNPDAARSASVFYRDAGMAARAAAPGEAVYEIRVREIPDVVYLDAAQSERLAARFLAETNTLALEGRAGEAAAEIQNGLATLSPGADFEQVLAMFPKAAAALVPTWGNPGFQFPDGHIIFLDPARALQLDGAHRYGESRTSAPTQVATPVPLSRNSAIWWEGGSGAVDGPSADGGSSLDPVTSVVGSAGQFTWADYSPPAGLRSPQADQSAAAAAWTAAQIAQGHMQVPESPRPHVAGGDSQGLEH